MKKLVLFKYALPFVLFSFFLVTVNTSLEDFFMPGTQPDENITYSAPSTCATCHSDIAKNSDISYEPNYGWQGNMMSQAMRDPLYLASLAIANQDADFAGDLCLRCHTPSGWLEGRSEPTDGSALTAKDFEGVDCHFCHELINPKSTDTEDLVILNNLDLEGIKPPQSGNGMFVMETDLKKRHGPYNDANPSSHDPKYDTSYSESSFCGTCHDVSNPIFKKTDDLDEFGNFKYVLDLNNDDKTYNTYDMFPSERTFSEWLQSDYAKGGISGTVFGGNKLTVSTCQDCHMQDVTGYGANKNSAPLRTDLPLHDMTGGNTFVPKLLTQLYPEYTNELNAGIERAKFMLQNAATMNVTAAKNSTSFELKVKITNETGHKLPSGYPEGRRMWIQVIATDIEGNKIFQSGDYDNSTAELEKLDSNNNDTKIYEAKLAMSETVTTATQKSNEPDGSSFHFALNNKFIKDNRIPPRGFLKANFIAIQAQPVPIELYEDGQFWDETSYTLPIETHHVAVKLLYQTSSKEYITFLRDENEEYKNDDTNSTNPGSVMYNLWETNGKSEPEIMNAFSENISDIPLSTTAIDYLFENKLRVFPNPTSGDVNISFQLLNPQNVIMEIFDVSGRKIKTLLSANELILKKNVVWNTENINSGLYILQLKIGDKKTSQRILVTH